MLIGLLMLLSPGVVFIVTLPFSRRLKPSLCKLYRIVGALVVFLGSGVSSYLASYTGDQGGVGAFFFQVTVICIYVVLSISLIGLNWFLSVKGPR